MLKFRRVNISIIISVSLVVSVLLNLPRVLELLDIIGTYKSEGFIISLKEITVKFLFLFLTSILLLELNANWYYRFKKKIFLVELVLTLLVHIAMYFCVIRLLLIIYPLIVGRAPLEVGFIYFGYGIIFVLLFFIAKILRYQVIHKEDLLEKEILKRQSIENELTALKNQINPHFLFNSLNSLNSLIRDNDRATAFVNKLSFMYRYILQSGETELVTLEKELKFLKSYIYLIKERYRDRVEVVIDLDRKWLAYTIPILSLQLLVENAVKHNEISEEYPLLVKIYMKENYLVIENKLRIRKTLAHSTGQGLENINKRYYLLKDKKIIINKSQDTFIVKLPLN